MSACRHVYRCVKCNEMILSSGEHMQTQYRYTYRCTGCGDTFNTNDAGRALCSECSVPLPLPIGRGTQHHTPGDNYSFQRAVRLIEDGETDRRNGR